MGLREQEAEGAVPAWEKLYTEGDDILRLRSGQALGVARLRPSQHLMLAMLIGERETEQAVGVLSRFAALPMGKCCQDHIRNMLAAGTPARCSSVET